MTPLLVRSVRFAFSYHGARGKSSAFRTLGRRLCTDFLATRLLLDQHEIYLAPLLVYRLHTHAHRVRQAEPAPCVAPQERVLVFVELVVVVGEIVHVDESLHEV